MIFDHQDISTKLYITHMVREWVRTDNNALILLQNPKVKEITEADLSASSTDDLVWTVLYLIGVGLFRYFVSQKATVFTIGMKPHWEKPWWIDAKTSKLNMNRHIDLLMENERGMAHIGVPLVPLQPSLDIISYRRKCLAPPLEPNRDAEKDIELIRANRKLYRAKQLFHRGL